MPDAGFRFIDQNGHRSPSCPLAPLLLAVYVSDPGFDMGAIDVVSDRNNLRKLLDFVTGDVDMEGFRVEVERVGTTTLFTRHERATSENIDQRVFRGFGGEFEGAYTAYPRGCERSTGHHRIISYGFGGLRFLVRFRADACATLGRAPSNDDDGEGEEEEEEEEEDDELSALMDGLDVGGGEIRTLRGGSMPAQSAIVKIKTRAAHRRLNMLRVLPQLWFAHTEKIVVAYHTAGRFVDIERYAMDQALDQWERRNTRNLRKLAQLLHFIVDAAKDAKGGKCSVVCDGGAVLEVVSGSDGLYVLPDALRRRMENPAW